MATGDWLIDDYVRPPYDPTRSVEEIHGWPRVVGDNEFDLAGESSYPGDILLAAVPVLAFGFLLACCCLPIGYCGAGSRQHHDDGDGCCGAVCPQRCKKGDHIGSGSLCVVMIGAVLTILGGALAIHGVRSADQDTVSMFNSLNGMGQDMVTAEAGVVNILGLVEVVEADLPTVARCAGLPSLGGIEEDIATTKDELGREKLVLSLCMLKKLWETTE
ncbi:unnamed protein product [Discosporangium mesarthrocarpum]